MMKNISKLVIIGGSASGAACAARARRLSEDCQIVLVEKTDSPSYASCGMPYYIGGEIENRDKLLVTPIPLLENGYNFDLRIGTEAIDVDHLKKSVTLKTKDGETYEEEYDKLVLAMGSEPFLPPIEGIKETKNVFTLGGMEDMDRIMERSEDCRSAVVVGGGFIGLEVAEQLCLKGIDVSVIELCPHVVPPLDEEMAFPIQKTFENNGVEVILNSVVTSVENNNIDDDEEVNIKVMNTLTSEDFNLEADLVLISTGVRPSSDIVSDFLETNEMNGSIVVSESLVTSEKDIYACGDLVECELWNDLPGYIPLANLANMQGRVAASHMFGVEPSTVSKSIGAGIFHVFDQTCVALGWSEERCKNLGVEYNKLYNVIHHRPGYMPVDAKNEFNMSMKLLFDDEGNILGFQAVGEKGVDNVGNLVSLAFGSGMTLFDLENAELPYCPYFGGARNPVNQLGMIAAGMLRGTHIPTFYEDVMSSPEALVVDVRPPEMFQERGCIPHPNIVNIPLGELRGEKTKEKLGDDLDREIVMMCNVGKMAYWGSRILQQQGYSNVKYCSGGWIFYKRHFEK